MIETRAMHVLRVHFQNLGKKYVLLLTGSSLKVVGTLSEVCDHIDVEECERRNIQVITMTSFSTDIVADLTVAVLQNELLANEKGR